MILLADKQDQDQDQNIVFPVGSKPGTSIYALKIQYPLLDKVLSSVGEKD